MTEPVSEHATLENLSTEVRTFPPSDAFAAQANAHAEMYAWAAADSTGFWAEQARTLLDWSTPFTQTLDWSGAPVARWFADGRLNACENAVDRHVAAGNGDRTAIIFEGEPGDTRVLTSALFSSRSQPCELFWTTCTSSSRVITGHRRWTPLRANMARSRGVER